VKTALSVAAALIAIAGIITLLSGSITVGIVLLVIAAVVGPGGYSIMK
jgi:hypothetical protein